MAVQQMRGHYGHLTKKHEMLFYHFPFLPLYPQFMLFMAVQQMRGHYGHLTKKHGLTPFIDQAATC
jgi:hypothetical protein